MRDMLGLNVLCLFALLRVAPVGVMLFAVVRNVGVNYCIVINLTPRCAGWGCSDCYDPTCGDPWRVGWAGIAHGAVGSDGTTICRYAVRTP